MSAFVMPIYMVDFTPKSIAALTSPAAIADPVRLVPEPVPHLSALRLLATQSDGE